MGYMAENSRRFFHPAAIDEMLSVFVPQINWNLLDVCGLPPLEK
jgi:proteasome activator subunit 4